MQLGSDPVPAGGEPLTPFPSPNCGPRRGGAKPGLVVLHYTAMADARSALERLCDPAAEVSAHYLVARDGEAFALVDEGLRAWHAGEGSWGGRGDVNSRSIGIELDNDGASPFSARQMDRLEALLAGIMDRHGIPPQCVIAHSDMAPRRKADPGPRFDWRRLARAGLSVWPGAEGDPAAPFPHSARRLGYDAPAAGEGGDRAVLDAFRLRFRPWARGPEDATDRALADDLARRFAVDRVAGDA